MHKPIMVGVSGSIGLLTVYFGILSLANSPGHAIEEFANLWYWISILVVGFGIQLGLFSYIRINIRKKSPGATAEVAAAGGISAGSMVACCAHHITDVLPLIGLSAAALFLVKYRLSFILLGVFSNIVGITLMLSIMQKYKLYKRNNILGDLFNYNMRTIRNIAVILSVIIVSSSFFLASSKTINPAATVSDIAKLDLQKKINDENFVSFEIKPLNFSFNKPLRFDVAINTHQDSLDFDLTKISFLKDDKENVYKPLSWQGDPPGGHHRYGILSFPKLKGKTKYIKLVIKDVYNVPERVLRWNLS